MMAGLGGGVGRFCLRPGSELPFMRGRFGRALQGPSVAPCACFSFVRASTRSEPAISDQNR